jgi:hypothetical protein
MPHWVLAVMLCLYAFRIFCAVIMMLTGDRTIKVQHNGTRRLWALVWLALYAFTFHVLWVLTYP